MKTELQEAMTSGVYVEVQDSQGNLVGQAVYAPWRGRPLPGVGDTMHCVVDASGLGRQKMLGRVVSRHFDLQHEADGQPCVWARLVVEAIPGTSPLQRRTPLQVSFSDN